MSEQQLNFIDQDHTVEWSEANLCLCWVTKSDGRAWFDWWENKPKYERDFLLSLYREYRERADRHTSGHMVPFDLVWADIDREAKQEEALITGWAQEIREAAMAMKPFPFVTPEKFFEEHGYVPFSYRFRLAAAIARAGIVIVERAAEEPAPKRRRRNAA